MGETSCVSLEAIKGGKGIRVEFQKSDELFAHTIFLLNQEQKQPVLISLQSHNDPFLPCFSELHEQGDILFLTGASGPCHWSMSVQVSQTRLKNVVDPSIRDSEAQFIFFDVACRHKEFVPHLSSEYHLNSNFDCSVDDTLGFGTIVGWDPIGIGWLRVGDISKTPHYVFDSKMRCKISQDADAKKVRLFSSDSLASRFPATVRWSYGFWMM